ncbi:hypothetical protein ACIPSJ_51815 [Streptomyces sp. NPDC090088]|uniref:hypothetical protein n=1 Tax=Streptomyces sp. NPDC090088 TaxID=3365944 RepID=UPI0037F9821D
MKAARELFAEQELGIGLNGIARHAGDGLDTACYNFPGKGQLIDALLKQRPVEIATLASEALDDLDA